MQFLHNSSIARYFIFKKSTLPNSLSDVHLHSTYYAEVLHPIRPSRASYFIKQ